LPPLYSGIPAPTRRRHPTFSGRFGARGRARCGGARARAVAVGDRKRAIPAIPRGIA